MTSKTCITCEFLLGKRTNPEDADRWKCQHPENIKGVNAVTGLPVYINESMFFNSQNKLENACKGQCWKEYIKPQFLAPEPITVKSSTSIKGVKADDL